MKLIVINGTAESGKDTFIEYLVNNIHRDKILIFNESTIDPVKKALTILGWDGTKTPENRQWMVDMKQLWIKRTNGQGCVDYVKNIYYDKLNIAKNHSKKILFIHCREPEEIEKISQTFNY